MIEVRIPKMGMSTVEVEVLQVAIEPGQTVAIGDTLIEVESEKVEMAIEAEHAGTVREVLVSVGQVCEVGDVICTLDD